MVSIALHPLAEEMQASIDTIQWVATAYLLATAIAIPLVVWAQERIGSKRLWITSLSIFLVGSILAGCAWDVWSLIAFRAVQGFGGGIAMPLMVTLVAQSARGKSLGSVMAVVGLAVVAGPILGPIIGGLVFAHLSWRWLFFINIPFAIVGLTCAVLFLPKDGPTRRPSFDRLGFLLLGTAITGMLYGLSIISHGGGIFGQTVMLPLGGGLLLLAVFVFWALHRREHAITDIRALRHWPVASSTMLLFLSGAALYGAMLLLPLCFQQTRGFDALAVGLLLVPQGIGTLFSRSTAGRLTDQIGGRWVVVVGFIITALGTVPFAFIDETTSMIWVVAVLLVRGVGLGAVTVPLMTIAFHDLEHHEIPHASLINRIGQQLGGSFGTALLAALLASALPHDLTEVHALTDAYHYAIWWTTGFALLAILVALSLPGTTQAQPERA